MMYQDIFNFLVAAPGLMTAGQPTKEQLQRLAGDGCTLVINLHTNDPRWELPNEAGLLERMGVEYHNVPVEFSAPSPEDYARFEQILLQRGERTTLVHCVANYRVTAFMALFGEKQLGWDRAKADAFIAQVWQPDRVWSAFLEQMRG